MDPKTIERIEINLQKILLDAKEVCQSRCYGMTNFRYRDIGEVFQIPIANGPECFVHIMPGFEQSIMVVRGPSLIALSRSHAEPVKENLLWTMTLRRDKDGQPVVHAKDMTIKDTVIAKLPAILQKRAINKIQIVATELMEEYTEFRGSWKKNKETVIAAQKMAQDFEGVEVEQPSEENDFEQTRERITDMDIPATLEI